MSEDANAYQNVAAGTATTTVKAAPGLLVRIVINTKGASSNTLTVYDNASAGSGTKIATIDTTTAVGAIEFGAYFRNGLTLVSATGTGADYTVVYQ